MPLLLKIKKPEMEVPAKTLSPVSTEATIKPGFSFVKKA
jgi:hypothetical protein